MPVLTSIVAIMLVGSIVAAIFSGSGTPRTALLVALAIILTDVAVCLVTFGGGAR